ncbi:hypothetical protein C4D60_Mb02t03530 [Musa balbisiana]|uniref:Uncharacterized protein n=1 Tax=Musa balbisiana TaxID=52838 RepID=A0A4S8I7Z4_MUSBA|nr:hypothetical protein C4D60_Mb02t03530 [Musa balbisiana]
MKTKKSEKDLSSCPPPPCKVALVPLSTKTPSTGACPIDTLKLDACIDLLGGLYYHLTELGDRARAVPPPDRAVPPPDRGGTTTQSYSETEPRRCHRLTGAVLPPSLTRRLSPGGATA